MISLKTIIKSHRKSLIAIIIMIITERSILNIITVVIIMIIISKFIRWLERSKNTLKDKI